MEGTEDHHFTSSSSRSWAAIIDRIPPLITQFSQDILVRFSQLVTVGNFPGLLGLTVYSSHLRLCVAHLLSSA